MVTREENPVYVYCVIETMKKGTIERIYFELIDGSNIKMIYDIDLDKYAKRTNEKVEYCSVNQAVSIQSG